MELSVSWIGIGLRLYWDDTTAAAPAPARLGLGPGEVAADRDAATRKSIDDTPRIG